MKVFSTCFKIIKRQLPQLSIYILIFLGLSIAFSFSSPAKDIENFTQSKTRVAFVNNDKDTELISGLKNYLKKYSVYVQVPGKTEELQDSLYYGDVEYLITIPEGFTDDIMNGRDVSIGKTEIPGSTSGIYTDILVNKFFDTARLYLESSRDITQADLVKRVSEDLKYETKVNMKKTPAGDSEENPTRYYYNYLAYILICVLLYGVSSIMMVFNNANLKRRNQCAPIRNISINTQILLGNLVYSIICWGLMIIMSFILYRGRMFTTASFYMCINSFVFMLTALSISFFVGLMVKGRNAQAAAANVLSLGLCFISGAFVPQEFLGKSVLAIANFTPTYWYIKANNAIEGLTNFNLENMIPVYKYMLIDLGFAIAILSVTLVVSKRKQMNGY
jgi:ABC-2 type transport system permease protein